MIKKTILAILGSALIVTGQVDSRPSDTVITIFPPPNAAFEELKQHLGLSDAQLDQLRKLLEERYTAQREIYRQMEEKHRELNNLLESGSRDAVRIGQLMIDIHALRTQQPQPADSWRQRALAVLTAEQRTKLVPLDQAMKLSTPAHQAVTFNLIDPPPPGRPIILDTETPAGAVLAPLPRELPTAPSPGTSIPLPRPLSR